VKRILAADIGGANARFAAFGLEAGVLRLERSLWLPTAGSPSFPALLERLAASDFPLDPRAADHVALALAGPVERGVLCRPPNIAWSLDLSRARADWGWPAFTLLNDFAAQAWACVSPAMDRARPVLPGNPDPEGVVAVIGPGTGLGMAALVPDGRGGFLVLATEGGHALFPLAGEEEFAFWRFARDTLGREQLIGDLVVSGSGLALLHRFLHGEEITPAEAAARFGPDSPVLAWFARFLGRACRHLALNTLALGGVVVAGGVAARNPEILAHPAFAAEFRASETHAALLARIPVRLNADQDAGLWGAARLAQAALERAPTAA
jgi:glucokinase